MAKSGQGIVFVLPLPSSTVHGLKLRLIVVGLKDVLLNRTCVPGENQPLVVCRKL